MSKKSYDDGAAAEFIAWLRGPDEYVSRPDLSYLLGLSDASSSYPSAGNNWEKIAHELGDGHTIMGLIENKGGIQRNWTRAFSKRAAMHIALRTRTDVSRQFRLWLVDQVAMEFDALTVNEATDGKA